MLAHVFSLYSFDFNYYNYSIGPLLYQKNSNMKKYVKVKVVAKNAPSGSYVAGCPTNNGPGCWSSCKCYN